MDEKLRRYYKRWGLIWTILFFFHWSWFFVGWFYEKKFSMIISLIMAVYCFYNVEKLYKWYKQDSLFDGFEILTVDESIKRYNDEKKKEQESRY